jgi:hypothetical protein
MKETHPFYCFKKQCQKSAWNTPEYLSKINWKTIEKIIGWIKANDWESFHSFLLKDNAEQGKEFFYRAIAWPEGYVYCQSKIYCEITGFPMIKKHLGDLQKAIDNRGEKE